MQLTYRGVRYQRPSQSLNSVGAIAGVYRGVPWQKRFSKSALVPRAIAQLKYRGVSYFQLTWGTPPQKSAASTRVPVGNP